MRIRIHRGFLTSRLGLACLGALLAIFLGGAGFVVYRWLSYGRMIDERLAGGHNEPTTARIYAAPAEISEGETLSLQQLTGALERDGYGPSEGSGETGWYSARGAVLQIHPGPASYFAGRNALRVAFAGGQVERIQQLDNMAELERAQIEPDLLTNIFDSSREKRRQVSFDDLPPVLVDAVLSAEDKRFFEHPGFDVVRIFGAAWADLRGDRLQGASTLTMQVARSFFFTTQRTWSRKIDETMVALELERRFTKKQIFELYANEIYLGNRGSFAIHGFAEGSLAYFNKDVHNLAPNEAAFLAGIIRAPNRYSTAERYPERAAEARDRVLGQMVENGYLTGPQAQEAKRAPLKIISGGMENSDAPNFVDMVDDHLLDRFSEADLQSSGFRVYTTLDPQLERAASEAVALGVANVDQQLARSYARWQKQGKPAQVQVAFLALDPRTGAIRALIGGRNYGESQLNHVLAMRQPGSVFKPIVYAAAFDTAVKDIPPILTPMTTVVDEPTTFDFDGKDYTPNDYGQEFRGTVTLRDALTYSLNVATVKVAEMVGYGRVVDMARQLGVQTNIQATPAVALGAYEMTPLDVAGVYTAFADGGTRVEPMFIDRVVNAHGEEIEHNAVRARQVLDPRVAYQVTDVLEDVIDRGTGASVRARGFAGPAAGKTGTSRDGWFAGYTSNLLCIVWVGFDDNRDLDLSGAASAAPIWAEFMKRATALPAYRNLQDFDPPDGITQVSIDPETQELATPGCPTRREEVFIAGTEPTEYCQVHGSLPGQAGGILSRLFGRGSNSADSPDSVPEPDADSGQPPSAAAASPARPHLPAVRKPSPAVRPASTDSATEEKKPGLLQRIFGMFGGSKSQDSSANGSPNPGR